MRDGEEYRRSVESELRTYENCEDVHHLPEIFHCWSRMALLPKLRQFGLDDINDLFKKFLARQCRLDAGRTEKRFVSIGAGNCDLEIEIARFLEREGCGDFVIDCLELNPAMLARGQSAAEAAGLSQHFEFIQTDINRWSPSRRYDAAMVNQSLHHIVNLEHLFAETKRSLAPGGCFIISDMIGRNGHQRWPEALGIVQEYWRKLPPGYRRNYRTGEYEEWYVDRDCSAEGFEGVRSEDILPLLAGSFEFELFLPFGNVIDPFVDRSFGPNFRVKSDWDRNFIEQVHQRDEAEIGAGRITPTHMLAVVRNDAVASPLMYGRLTPEFCIRDPKAVFSGAGSGSAPGDPYGWEDWPRDTRLELLEQTKQLHAANAEAGRLRSEVQRVEDELTDRTRWALELDQKRAARESEILRLNRELEERTAWALGLDREVKSRRADAAQADKEIQERTAWALGLEKQLGDRTSWALRLRDEARDSAARVDALAQELVSRNVPVARVEPQVKISLWPRAARFLKRGLSG